MELEEKAEHVRRAIDAAIRSCLQAIGDPHCRTVFETAVKDVAAKILSAPPAGLEPILQGAVEHFLIACLRLHSAALTSQGAELKRLLAVLARERPSEN